MIFFRETYSSLSPYNTEEKREYRSAKLPTKDTRLYRTSSGNSDKAPGSSKGKCRASPLDRSKSLSHLPSCSSGVKIERTAKSTENIAQSSDVCRKAGSAESVQSEPKLETSAATSNPGHANAPPKPSRSQKNKTLLKSVIAECLELEGISPNHPRFKSISSKLYDIGKLMLKDSISGSQGIRDTMMAIIKPQASIVVDIERRKEKS